MTHDMKFPLTYSGVRPGETKAVKDLIAGAGLSVEDLNSQKLRHFIVARRGDALVGTVGLEPAGPDALLRSLAVAAHCRRQAIGRGLVAAIEKYARSHGAMALYLLTMDAADFFRRQGYEVVARPSAPAGIQATEEFHRICPASAQCLWKRLAP